MPRRLNLRSTSADALLLTVIKLVTMAVGLVLTRMLSDVLTRFEYGTYSQILLLVSTVSSFTLLGLTDGINYFFCSRKDVHSREAYIATMYALQLMVSVLAGAMLLLASAQIARYLGNQAVKPLMVFAAVMPMTQNLLAMTQVLIVSVGKARILAIRNFVVSVLRVLIVAIVIRYSRNIALILAVTLVLDVGQLVVFDRILRKNDCRIALRCADAHLVRSIVRYAIPMAMTVLLNTVNRDLDKYVISYFMDTEMMAVYANASKVLPVNLIMISFTTVLLPQITRGIVHGLQEETTQLYCAFLQVSYLSAGILAFSAIAAGPQLMMLLYTEKYVSGIAVFSIYLLVDFLQFTNITLILSASDKTRTLMRIALAAVLGNLVLNVLLFRTIGMEGPAIATLFVTLLTGVVMMHISARQLHTGLQHFFDLRVLIAFLAAAIPFCAVLRVFGQSLSRVGWHYLAVLLLIGGTFAAVLSALFLKPLLHAVKSISSVSAQISKKAEESSNE